ncbi:UNKNOWN [Stylonychia lemnae]|uniref:Uncharacterized protein n=1 Tax=Stylonychia lemnae TaxID=5949 RepID=A0A078ACH0_STYLE|nr:UNKNOWN [Stylonychia lemnae]|eukprot:CDW79945.1 UNKNOWN [Stylonychia lemnae]
MDQDKYQSRQNREYIKQRVSNIIKDITKSNSASSSSTMKENNLISEMAKTVSGTPYKRSQVVSSALYNHQNNSALNSFQTSIMIPESEKSDSNQRYQAEIEKLKKTLNEMSDRENKMSQQLNQHEQQIEMKDSFINQLELKDEIIKDQQNSLMGLEQQIEYLVQLNKDLNQRVSQSLLECQKYRAYNDQNQMKINILESEINLLRQENERIRMKPMIHSKQTQTIQRVKLDAMTCTSEFPTVIPRNSNMETFADKDLNFTLNNQQQEFDKNFGSSTITSPKCQSSYMQTPTRSALQQFINNSSTKKKDDLYRSHLFNRSSAIKETQTNTIKISRNSQIYQSNSAINHDHQGLQGCPKQNQNLKCSVQNKMSSTAQLANFITKAPQNPNRVNANQILVKSPEKSKLTKSCEKVKQIMNEKRNELKLVSPSAKDYESSCKDQLRCPRRDIASDPNTTKANTNLQRTPQNTKKSANNSYQKASSILRQRYQSTIPQNLTPVRQQRTIQQQTQGSQLNSHRSDIPIAPVAIQKSEQKKQSVLTQYTTKPQNIKTIRSNQISNKSLNIKQQSQTSRSMLKSDSDASLGKSQLIIQKIKICQQQSQQQQPIQIIDKSKIVNSNQHIQSILIKQGILKSNLSQSILNSEAQLVSIPSNPELRIDNVNKLFLDQLQSLDNNQQNICIKRKAILEEEKKRGLIQKIQIKDEKIHNLIEIKKQEQHFRDLTYEQRRDQFKNEVKERRENLSKTPNKNIRTSSAQNTHMNSVSRNNCCNYNGRNSNLVQLKTDESQIMLMDEASAFKTQYTDIQFNAQMMQQSCVSPLRKTIRPRASEGKVSRKFLVNPEEEDEAPQPLNVKISPIVNQQKMNYEM